MTKRKTLKRRRLNWEGEDHPFEMAMVAIAALTNRRCPDMGSPYRCEYANYYHLSLTLDIHDGRQWGRQVWERYRHVAMVDHIADYPGTRPAAYWRYDAPEHPGIDETSPPEVQARFLKARGQLSKEEIKRIPKAWLAPAKPILSVINKGD